MLFRSDSLKKILQSSSIPEGISKELKFEIRRHILTIASHVGKIMKSDEFSEYNIMPITDKEAGKLNLNMKEMRSYTEFAPWYVILMISISLGLGTMVGWKRIVVTIGEKIGKTHLTYAQGASTQIIATSTISISTALGLPVSTTHVLSSGVAGSMVSEGGVKNLQFKTIKNILIAWGVTIPVTIVLACALFLGSRWIFGFFI